MPAISLSAYDIAQMIDVSAVRTDSTDEKIRELVACAKRYHCYLVTALPSQTENAKTLLGGLASPKLGGNVGFPSGGQTTRVKLQETRELLEMGVDEIDMVIDIAALLSGRYQHVCDQIAAIVDACQGRPVKAILECYYLNDDQLRQACDLAIRAGAAFVKTSTGWTPVGTTLENISLIKTHVGDTIQIKASGGIRDQCTLLEMHRRGASRFGISSASAIKILQSLPNPK
jgi:deoxyribose-phosphate aldolase